MLQTALQVLQGMNYHVTLFLNDYFISVCFKETKTSRFFCVREKKYIDFDVSTTADACVLYSPNTQKTGRRTKSLGIWVRKDINHKILPNQIRRAFHCGNALLGLIRSANLGIFI